MNESMSAEPMFPLLNLVRLRMGTDGNGITTLVAGAGCPLSCRWCINQRLLRNAPADMIDPPELLSRVIIDDLYFRATNGGIAFGGGESLLHAAFISRFRRICPPEWRIIAETSLSVPRELLDQAIPAVDEYIVDCKDLDEDRYRCYTGGDAALMTDNISYLLDKVGPDRILVRIPLIPDYNTRADQKKNAEILMKMGIRKTELFDYVIRPDMQ